MAAKFNADEVLNMAQRIEERGSKFYRKAAKLHIGARDLLMEIARQEDAHHATFSEMRKALTESEKEGTTHDPYGESELYLKAMVEGQAFDINSNPEEAISGKESIEDIFKMAIQFEKDSIVFYLGLRDMVPPSFGKDKLDAIVREEMRHIRWLSEKQTGV